MRGAAIWVFPEITISRRHGTAASAPTITTQPCSVSTKPGAVHPASGVEIGAAWSHSDARPRHAERHAQTGLGKVEAERTQTKALAEVEAHGNLPARGGFLPQNCRVYRPMPKWQSNDIRGV